MDTLIEKFKLAFSLFMAKDTDSILKAFNKAQARLDKYAELKAKDAARRAAESARLLREAREIDEEVKRAMKVSSNFKKLCGGEDVTN